MKSMNKFNALNGHSTLRLFFAPSRVALVGAVALSLGAGIAQAGDGPDVYGTIREFAPARRAAPAPQPVVQRFEAPLPKMFRSRQPSPPPMALGFAPAQQQHNAFWSNVQKIDPGRTDMREFPRGEAQGDAQRPQRKKVRAEARRKLKDHESIKAAGIATSTNYCVRLCDGYAFPVGDAGGNVAVQEYACRAACPGAETALYSAPAGARDFDAMSRGGASYSTLPNAFRYREKLDSACRCNAPGTATNTSAVLTDLTLKKGDIVLSRLGFRHFDGASQLPYRARNFSDAVSRLTVKHEVAIVRAMEVASVPGILSPKAPDYMRERVSANMRQIRQEASRELAAVRHPGNLGKGFQELRAREAQGKTTLKTVQKGAGFVALN